MKSCKRSAIGCLAVILCLFVPPAQAGFDAGLAAYTRLYDYQRAYRELLAEGQHGHREAQFYLGEICEGGIGRPIDYSGAFHWYLSSARQGYGPAQARLAQLYRSGRGTKMDPHKAFEWQLKAAEQGQVVAQYRLGGYYAEGIGTLKDPVRAYMWLTIAASWGDPDAMPERESLARNLSAPQIAQASQLAQHWEKEHRTKQAGEYLDDDK